MQHQAEKATIQEQFDFIYKKYKEKKDEVKKVQDQKKAVEKMLEREKKFRDNQRKIYEKMFTEGMSLEDVHRVMERYMEKVDNEILEDIDAKDKYILDGNGEPTNILRQ